MLTYSALHVSVNSETGTVSGIITVGFTKKVDDLLCILKNNSPLESCPRVEGRQARREHGMSEGTEAGDGQQTALSREQSGLAGAESARDEVEVTQGGWVASD